MTHTPHEMAEDFPEHKQKIRDLKATDAHFARLADEYHQLNREVHRMETRVEPVSEQVEEMKRRQRMLLKDKIAAYLD